MRLGFTQVFNEVNWIGYAIDQAMNLCDKLLICEGSQFTVFPDIPERSNDGTLDIIADKKRRYSKRIKVVNTIRKHNNYRLNQCANFNLGLTFCNIGDYFIQLDADEFYPDEWITEISEIIARGKASLIKVLSYNFAFGFNWQIKYGDIESARPIIVKKARGFHFVPTHKWINPGNDIIVIPQIGRYHYGWLKPRERMRMRMKTSGMYPNMLHWFDKNWNNFKLENGKEYPYYKNKFTLYRYKGKHPSILNNHPWRHIEDIRKLAI